MLPRTLIEPLKKQLKHAKRLHQYDLAEGFGEVEMPHALARKYPQMPQRVGVGSTSSQQPRARLTRVLVGWDGIISWKIRFSAP